MTSSPEPQDSRRRLTWDEWIAIVVALTGIGSVFLWALNVKVPGWDATWTPSQLLASPIAKSPAPEGTVGRPTGSLGVATLPPSQPATLPSPNAAAAPVSPPPVAQPWQFLPLAKAPQPAAPDANVTAPAPASPVPSAVAPAVPESPAVAPEPTVSASPKQFVDVPAGFWASPYIAELSRRGILTGVNDKNFQPNQPITRAEFAAMVQKGFEQPKVKQAIKFSDVPTTYRGLAAIDEAIQTGFMTGYPKQLFRPDQKIPRVQLQVALVTGLNLPPVTPSAPTLAKYGDAATVPKWATGKLATAIAAGIVVKDADATQLKPNQVATRADAAALIYQALVKAGKIKPSPNSGQ
jgi:S-layer homology domain